MMLEFYVLTTYNSKIKQMPKQIWKVKDVPGFPSLITLPFPLLPAHLHPFQQVKDMVLKELWFEFFIGNKFYEWFENG